MKTITFFPYGGLGNRMRTIASAVAFSKDSNASLKIIWYAKADLNSRFDALFQPMQMENVKLVERNHFRYRLQKWLFPTILHPLVYQKCLYGVKQLTSNELKESNYISSCYDFYPFDSSLLQQLFRPSDELQKRIDVEYQKFATHTIGVHIRRTDHVDAIAQSPTSLFIERMKGEIEKNQDVKFYLATDSEEDKQKIMLQFGERIITNPQKADRNSVEGMESALIEMYLLSKTDFIVGSFQSTFSEMAALLGNITCEYITKDVR